MTHPGGRPTELTPEVLEDVKRLLPTCLYLETVADYLSLDRTTVRKWIRRGSTEHKRLARNPKAKPKQKELIFVEFFLAYKKALAEGEIYDLGVIKKAGADQWQAAAWRTERRFPERWGRDRQLLLELVKEVKAIRANDEQGAENKALPGTEAATDKAPRG